MDINNCATLSGGNNTTLPCSNESISQHPMVQAVLEAFPGVSYVDVRAENAARKAKEQREKDLCAAYEQMLLDEIASVMPGAMAHYGVKLAEADWPIVPFMAHNARDARLRCYLSTTAGIAPGSWQPAYGDRRIGHWDHFIKWLSMGDIDVSDPCVGADARTRLARIWGGWPGAGVGFVLGGRQDHPLAAIEVAIDSEALAAWVMAEIQGIAPSRFVQMHPASGATLFYRTSRPWMGVPGIKIGRFEVRIVGRHSHRVAYGSHPVVDADYAWPDLQPLGHGPGDLPLLTADMLDALRRRFADLVRR